MSGTLSFAYQNFPPFVMGGWFPTMAFPSRWYHPVLGSRMVNTAADLATLAATTKQPWFPTAGLADICRTEEEAAVVIELDRLIQLNVLGVTTTPALPQSAVNRRSAAWQAVIDQGYWITPLVAAVATEMAGPAPVTEGRQPSHTLAPGQSGTMPTEARTQQIPPTA